MRIADTQRSIHRWDEDRIIRRTLHFCMGKCDKNSEGKNGNQLEEMWEYAQSIAEDEDKDPEPPKFKKLDKATVTKTAEKINSILKNKNSRSQNESKGSLH